MNHSSILENIIIVSPVVKIWTGQVKLQEHDIKLGDGGKLPPEEVAQLGMKKVFDPSKLAVFSALKTEARRYLEGIGMPFLNGFALPADKEQDVIRELSRIEHAFFAEKDNLLNSFNKSVEQWVAKQPEYEAIIRAGVPAVDRVKKRIDFEFSVFKIAGAENEEAHGKMAQKVANLGDDLFSEVTKDASEFYKKYLSGKTSVNKATKRSILPLRDKVAGLVFLNEKLRTLIKLLDEVLRAYDLAPQKGRYLDGSDFARINSIIMILADREKIDAYSKENAVAESEAPAADPVAQVLPAEGNASEIGKKQDDLTLAFERYLHDKSSEEHLDAELPASTDKSCLHKVNLKESAAGAKPVRQQTFGFF